jgi:hypothetical protein
MKQYQFGHIVVSSARAQYMKINKDGSTPLGKELLVFSLGVLAGFSAARFSNLSNRPSL